MTGTDISQTALDVAAQHAAEAGVTRHLGAPRLRRVSLPAGPFDLVTASFLHSDVELPARPHPPRRGRRWSPTAARCWSSATRPSPEHHHHDLPSLDEVVAELALPEDGWELQASELRERQHAFRGEAPKTRVDTVVRFRRR